MASHRRRAIGASRGLWRLLFLASGLVLPMLTARHLAAQETWIGVVGGIRKSGFRASGDGPLWNRTRVTSGLGLSVRYALSRTMALHGEIRYAQLGGGRRYESGQYVAAQAANVAVAYKYLELPIQFEASVPIPHADRVDAAIRGGPLAAFMLACEFREETTASDRYVEPASGVSCESRQPVGPLVAELFGSPRAVDIGMALDGLVRINVSSRVAAEVSARWRIGLRGVDVVDVPELKQRSLSLGIGIAGRF